MIGEVLVLGQRWVNGDEKGIGFHCVDLGRRNKRAGFIGSGFGFCIEGHGPG